MQTKDGAGDVQMEDVTDDEPAPPSSPVHAGITKGEACAHYTEMVLAEREATFRQVQADQEYNVCLLDEHRCAEELLAGGTATAPDVDVLEQEALLKPYRSARDIHRDR